MRGPRRSSRFAPVGLLLASSLAACRPGAPPTGVQPSDACVVMGGEAPASVSVAIPHTPEPAHAPAPRNTSERFVFRQLYETLVYVDCSGRVVPGLAESWSADDDGRVWSFRLRPDAAFWDGSPVLASDIAAGWAANAVQSARAAAAFARITAQGDHGLRIELRAPTHAAYLFAHPDFAVSRRTTETTWPVGSGPFRIESGAGRRSIRIAADAAAGRGTALAPQAIEFRTVATTDARQALDTGVDVLVSRDPAVVQYARALPEYTVTPLSWSRTYALVSVAGTGNGHRITSPPPEARLALARDAVSGDVRPAAPPASWQDGDCRLEQEPRQPATPPQRARRPAIVYPQSDAIARGIAERLVALAWPVARAPDWLRALLPDGYAAAGAPAALGLRERELVQSLDAGNALAFVLPLPRSSAGECAAPAPADVSGADGPLSAREWHIAPLLDARDHLIHRHGLGRTVIDDDGTVRFAGGAP